MAYRKTSTGKNPPTNNDVYKRVTERLIAALERGEQPPWQRPWKLIGGMPMSMSTGKRYTGCNPWLLMATSMERGYSSRWWGTAHQVNELGGHITKGQNQASGCGATPVIFFKTLDRAVTDPATGEVRTEKFPMARIFHLFNFEQCAGLPEKYAAPKLDDLEKLPEPEKVLAAYFEHGGPELRHGGNSAHYSPQADVITLPQPGAFRSPAHYAAVAAHEAVHSSGHPSRLNRPGIAEFDHFGSAKYSAEELCAQFGSALICAETGVESDDLYQNDVAYLSNWAAKLRDDPKIFITAASQAQRAADMIMEPSRELQRDAEVQADVDIELPQAQLEDREMEAA